MTPEEASAIGSFLDSFGTLTLATHGPCGPWAASLFYARDEQLNLYFISSEDSRHARELRADQRVAVTVNTDHSQWAGIRGLQIAATAEPVEAQDRPSVETLYLMKSKELQPLLAAPGSAAEDRIAQKFNASLFFRIRPITIRLIDNTQGFAHAQEFQVRALPGVD